MGRGRKRKIKEKELIEAIKDTGGLYSVIARKLAVDWHTVDRAIKDSPDAQQAVNDEKETTLDMVESKALRRIQDGDGAMIRFYLATKGKKRGYTYVQEQEIDSSSEDNDLNITVDGEPINTQCEGESIEDGSTH